MTNTVVGIFDEYEDAVAARDKLMDAGIDTDSIQVASERGEQYVQEPEQPDRRGFFARLFGLGDSDENAGHYAEAVRRGSTAVTVTVDDDIRVETVSRVLDECGAIDVDERVDRWRQSGYTGFDAKAPVYGDEDIQRERERFQVVQEDLKIGKRDVSGGRVRVHRRVSETPVEETVELRSERAEIERRPVDRPATEADLQQAFGDKSTIEITEHSEEPVVSKTARVVEEVDVGKKVSTRTEKVRDSVRRTDVEVENAGEPAMASRSMGDRVGSKTRYSGPERRIGSDGSYSGPERRTERRTERM